MSPGIRSPRTPNRLTTETTSWERVRSKVVNVYCGLDWAEHHHDVALVDEVGALLARQRITDDAAGYRLLLELLAEHGDTPQNPIAVAIETSRGLLVATLRTGSRCVYAAQPARPSQPARWRHRTHRRRTRAPRREPDPHRLHGRPRKPCQEQLDFLTSWSATGKRPIEPAPANPHAAMTRPPEEDSRD